LAQLLDLFGFLAVVLRALILAFGSIAIGGVTFYRFVWQGPIDGAEQGETKTGLRLMAVVAVCLAATQSFYLLANTAILRSTAGLTVAEITGAGFFLWGCISLFASLALAVLVFDKRVTDWMAFACCACILAASVGTSHAAARLDHQILLLAGTAAHQGATAFWIGGLPYLLLSLRGLDDSTTAIALARRFSYLALLSVGALVCGGILLSYFYLGSVEAIYGTNYGLMLSAKVLLFGMIMLFGALNFKLVRQLNRGENTLLLRLRTFGEAEIGIGITVVLAAASLTSQPPGVDLPLDRVQWATIADRMTPRAPRMTTPPLSTLSPSSREQWKKEHAAMSSSQSFVPGQSYTPPTEGDIEWSEYNHHWAGLVVLVMGVLAVLSRFSRFRWARHWPLAFIGLSVFLLLRADPENWPLGPSGFWESFSSADVSQHRLFVLLILMFAAFEWGVQTGRLTSQKAALVFPVVCAAGGAMLLTHTHALANIKEELLAEFSHVPLALLAVMAGWARWLEIRLPGSGKQLAGRIWPVCFALIGVVLLLYREA
jgi:putative copper resistance protein D